MILLWLGASHWQMQQALRWWYQRASLERAAQADQIQNTLLQDLFALRLSLSAASDSSLSEALFSLDQLHQGLSNLSATLTYSYLSDSLPLAIQSLLQQWQIAHSAQQIQLDLPTSWPQESPERSRIILEMLAAWLELAADPETSDLLGIRLTQQDGRAELTLRLVSPNAAQIAATHATELRYLRDCFRCLMPGWCRHQTQSGTDISQFHWKVRPFSDK